MNTAAKLIARDLELLTHPADPSAYYQELTQRNRHFVAPSTQQTLSQLKILIAGCGAGGGACTLPLARLGVQHFRLADNGNYEISNLNRQNFFTDHLGQNKAEAQAEQILKINPYADVQADPRGITPQNVQGLVDWADLIIDAVDVTNPESIQMKFLLHQVAKQFKKPVLSPLDPGLCQYGQTYDYRNPKLAVLNGKLARCQNANHPMKALFSMFSVSDLPAHTLPLLNDLLTQATQPASQLAISADLLSGVIGAAAIRFAETGELVSGWRLDLEPLAYSRQKRFSLWLRSLWLRPKLKLQLYRLK